MNHYDDFTCDTTIRKISRASSLPLPWFCFAWRCKPIYEESHGVQIFRSLSKPEFETVLDLYLLDEAKERP